jgi:hypothetical protein
MLQIKAFENLLLLKNCYTLKIADFLFSCNTFADINENEINLQTKKKAKIGLFIDFQTKN